MRLTIRLKLLLAIGIPYILVTAIALGIDYTRQRDEALRSAQIELSRIAGRGAAELNGFFAAAANIPATIADATEAGGIPADDAIFATLRAVLTRHPDLYGACFAVAPEALAPGRTRFAPYVCRDGNGAGALRSMDLSTGYDYTLPQWEWYARPMASGAPWWTEPYFDEGAGNAAMVTYSAPVRTGGRIAAIATVDVLLEDIQRRLTPPTDLPEARWIILSRDGTFVSVSEPELLLRSTVFALAARERQPALDALARRMVAGERGAARFASPEDERPHLASFEPIPATGWSFAMHAPEATILGPVYTRLRERLIAFSLGSLVLLGVVVGVAFWIARPIPRLAAAVREVGAGRLDARVPGPRTRDELGELAAGFDRMVEELKRHVESLTAATAARERVEGELRIARDIQLSLLPSTFPAFPERPEFDLHALNTAARSIAGDFFDFELLPGGRLYFTIADVSGKGIPAAMFMAVTRTVLRNLVRTTDSPAAMLDGLNRVLVPDNRRSMFVTMFIGIYDVVSGRLVYANAGHPEPRIVAPDGRCTVLGEPTGPLVGVIPDAAWADAPATLARGETLLAFTDGVSEAGMGDRPLYGLPRLDALLRTLGGRTARDVCAAVAGDVAAYQGEHASDDLTLVALRRT